MVLVEIVYCHNALQEILPAFSLPDSQLLFVFFFLVVVVSTDLPISPSNQQ